MRKAKGLFALLLISILVIAGCSDTSKDSPDKGSEKEVEKDLIVAFGAEPLTVDPQNAGDAMSNQANDLLYDKLATFDKDNKIVPDLATEWETTPDGLEMTFTLREDVKFQDGTPFNAEAVKVNFDRVLNPDNQLARTSLYADFISEVVVDSEFQVTFKFLSPFGPAISTFAHGAGGIISPKAIADNQDLDMNPAGTGPYKLEKWIPGTEMVFEAHTDYWGTKPQLETITFKPVPENSSRSIMLENGEVHIISPIGTQDVERLQGTDKVKVDLAPIYRNLYLTINTKKQLFQDARVRQALNYAVDKEIIVEKILNNQAKVSEAAVGSTLSGYSSVGSYPYDLEKAKELLKEAGVKEGTKIKLWTPDGRYLMDSKVTEYIQASLTELGFEVEFQKWEWSSYSNELDNPESDFDLMIGSWGASSGDIDWGLRPTLSTDGASNYGKYSNPEFDKLIVEGLTTSDKDKRIQIYNDAMTIIKEDAPWLFLVEYVQPVGMSDKLKGVYTLGNGYVILREAAFE